MLDRSNPPSEQASRFARIKLALVERLGQDQMPTSLLWAALVGLLGALATVAFRSCISSLVFIFTGQHGGLVEAARHLAPVKRMLWPALGGLAAGCVLWLERRIYGRDAGGDYMESITIGNGDIGVGKTMMRSFSSLLSISSGGSIGREGPMVQLAAMLASAIGRFTEIAPPRRRLLVACGAAAGITSAYNAPISGAFFVAEIVLGSIAMESFGPLLVASMVANVTIHAIFGYGPLYAIPAFAAADIRQSFSFVALGLAAGFCGPLFLGLINGTKRLVERVPLPLPLKLAAGGLIVGIISITAPEVWGNGYSTVNEILGGQFLGPALVSLLIFKLAATTSTVGSGAIGGVFTPTLFVGATLGALASQILAFWWPAGAPPLEASTAVAMGAFLAATTQAPVTSILMIFEMTGTYQVVLPLMLACVPAYVVVRLLGVPSIYAAAQRAKALQAQALDLTAQTVAAYLRPDPPSLHVNDGIERIIAAFATHRFQYLYVVDDSGLYRGAVSLHDLRQFLADFPEGTPERQSMQAQNLLATGLQSLDADMSLEKALAAFTHHRGERLPVIDHDGKLVGAAWKTDLMLELQERLGRNR